MSFRPLMVLTRHCIASGIDCRRKMQNPFLRLDWTGRCVTRVDCRACVVTIGGCWFSIRQMNAGGLEVKGIAVPNLHWVLTDVGTPFFGMSGRKIALVSALFDLFSHAMERDVV